MNRRQALLGAGALAAGQFAADAQVARAAAASAASPTTRALYALALVLDANLSPPFDGEVPLKPSAKAMIRNAGVSVAKATIGGFNEDFASTLDEIAFFQRAIEADPDVLMQVRTADDIALAHRSRRLGIIFSFEGVAMLDGKIERIELFRNLGVRVMQLSYNTASPFASGVLAQPPAGLTRLGREAVERMNAVGVAIDLSHANPATTADVLQASKRPVLITHAGCAAVHAHPRNKTDAQLRAVAAKGGVVGIYDLPYLTASPRQPALPDYLDHMVHALKVCGEDHVGIGSDQGIAPFDTGPASMKAFAAQEEARHKAGVAAPEEDRLTYVEGLNIPRRAEAIADGLLRRGYSEHAVEKVLGLNFARAFGEIWGPEAG